MFEVKTSFSFDEGKLDISEQKLDNCIEFVGRTEQNNGVKGYLKQLNILPNKKDTISVSQVGTITAQIRYNDWYASQNIFILSAINDKRLVSRIVLSSINKMLKSTYSQGYSNYPTLSKLSDNKIQLPTKNGKIDFEFMESFVAELEAQRVAELEAQRVAELEAYLTVTGLKDYELTEDERDVLIQLKNGMISWEDITFEQVFNKIVQGRRLKKEDHLPGKIPFVMAGVTNTGVVNYISNPIAKFDRNAITVDIFGNVFYRSYDFGAGDDTGVYWNDKTKYSSEIMLFFASSMSKALLGKYSYGKKLRSSQSKDIKMKVCFKNGEIDFNYMGTLIRAVQKLVIKDVVCWADKKIEATKQVIEEK